MVDYLRSCYCSVFRLNTDPAILTPGRFYFAHPDTPAAPVGHLRGSRNYTAEDGKAFQEWGELDGQQKWDNGAPPVFVPDPVLVGSSDCLGGDGPGITPRVNKPDSFRTVCIGGRDYLVPTLIYVSFSVARHNREFTYYNDVELTLIDAECEARYEGPSGIEDVTAIVRVIDQPEGNVRADFYLCERQTVPPVVTACCGTAVSAVLRVRELAIKGWHFFGPPSPPEWEILADSVVVTHSVTQPPGTWSTWPIQGGWYGYVKCDGSQGTPDDWGFKILYYCQAVPGPAWVLVVYNAAGDWILNTNDSSVSTVCSPFAFDSFFQEAANFGSSLCGNLVGTRIVYMDYRVEEND